MFMSTQTFLPINLCIKFVRSVSYRLVNMELGFNEQVKIIKRRYQKVEINLSSTRMKMSNQTKEWMCPRLVKK